MPKIKVFYRFNQKRVSSFLFALTNITHASCQVLCTHIFLTFSFSSFALCPMLYAPLFSASFFPPSAFRSPTSGFHSHLLNFSSSVFPALPSALCASILTFSTAYLLSSTLCPMRHALCALPSHFRIPNSHFLSHLPTFSTSHLLFFRLPHSEFRLQTTFSSAAKKRTFS
jgi:hypothetical protein